ncbi:MAG: hypothetical protein IMF06_00300 [Proteobacteria bacterium]|nr:hypothetical protein [Pseudomonadota bacterium]
MGYYRQLGESAAAVDLGWRIHLGSGDRDFRTTYMCAIVNERWRIINAVAYEGSSQTSISLLDGSL